MTRNMEIKYTIVNENLKNQPKKATSGSAGFDLTACVDGPVVINPNQSVIIPSGIAISIGDQSFVGLVFARSGLAIKHGIALSNGVGVIDSDYTGEIKVGLVNLSDKPYTVHSSDRIAQIVIMPIASVQFVLTDKLEQTQRGENGFGSTGK